jgi:restriction system protein
MPIPDYQTLMLPLLRCFADGKEHSIQDLVNTLAREFSLSPEELRELLPSGKQTVFYSRVGWAKPTW